jgi:hypothetical protein
MNAWIFVVSFLLTVGVAAYFIRDERKSGHLFSWKQPLASLLVFFPWCVGVLAILSRGWALVSAGWMLAR